MAGNKRKVPPSNPPQPSTVKNNASTETCDKYTAKNPNKYPS